MRVNLPHQFYLKTNMCRNLGQCENSLPTGSFLKVAQCSALFVSPGFNQQLYHQQATSHTHIVQRPLSHTFVHLCKDTKLQNFRYVCVSLLDISWNKTLPSTNLPPTHCAKQPPTHTFVHLCKDTGHSGEL